MKNTLNTANEMNTANNTKNATKRLLATMWFEKNFRQLSDDNELIVIHESLHTYYDKVKGCCYKLTTVVNLATATESLIRVWVTANGNPIDTDSEVVATLQSDCQGDLVLACEIASLAVYQPHRVRVARR